jgi:hypothetical protein
MASDGDLGPLITFVFRLDEMGVTWSAYVPGNPTHPIMTDINQYGDKWGWNCYDIGQFDTRNELVKHYLSIKDKIRYLVAA